MAGKLIIHGLTGFMIGGTLKMFLDGTELGSVRPKETAEFNISNGGNLTLKCGINPSKAGLYIEDGYITEVSCKYNRVSGNFWMEQISSKPINTPAAQIEEVEKPIYILDGKVKDVLYVYEDRAVITHRGVLNAFAMGVQGDKTIYYVDITSIQYKKPGVGAGYMQFALPGESGNRGGTLAAMNDENTISIAAGDGNLIRVADEIHEFISRKIREAKGSARGGTTVVQQTSAADELKKFKELLDMGIITQEEFDAKKKQLLGL